MQKRNKNKTKYYLKKRLNVDPIVLGRSFDPWNDDGSLEEGEIREYRCPKRRKEVVLMTMTGDSKFHFKKVKTTNFDQNFVIRDILHVNSKEPRKSG